MKSLPRNSSLALTIATVAVGATLAPIASFAWFGAPAPQAGVNATDGASNVQLADRKCPYNDGAFTGGAFDAYFGNVQVTANISGGCVVSIDVPKYPTHRPRSRRISEEALPMLQEEVISVQSSRIDIISGATLTSEAYVRSLRDALKQASP